MRTWTLAFLIGILLLQQFTFLPSQHWVIIGIASGFLLEYFFGKKFLTIRLLSAVLFGFVWSLWYAHAILAWSLPKNLEGQTIQISGYIAAIPNQSAHRTAFLFKLKKIQAHPVNAFIKLSWQNAPIKLHAGEQWQFKVRLKRIHGLMNPGGFDYEAWAFQEGIRASGYIVASGENQLLSHHWYHYSLHQLRQKLLEKIEMNLPLSNTSAWISALALGERQNISAEKWEVLRKTGTNHLMAIAGLHIGFMAGFIFFLVEWSWCRIPPFTLRFPAQYAGALGALGIALIYSAMAGFSIPTQRACIMLSIVLVMLLMRRVSIAWHSWCMAMLCVLVLNPLSVLTESFWLSFGSVALIIYGVSSRLRPKGLWWKLGRIQWVIALGLIPLSIWLFQESSIISFIANSIAIPWVGFIIVPLTLAGCVLLLFSIKLGTFVLILADKMLALLWLVLSYLAHISWAAWHQVIPQPGILLVACIGVVILLLPAGFPGRFFGIVWFLPLIFYHYPTPKAGEVWFTLLDVGQGLSAVLQTKNHVVVFDAGPKLSEDYDMGESVVTPFLRSLGVKKIDLLIISHGDNDHVGGAGALFKHFKVLATQTSDPSKLLPITSQFCLQGQTWEWDKVNFSFLYPSADTLNLNNDSSCVLRVTDEKQKHFLLTGDIEKFAENYLLQTEFDNLTADVLVAPHHGSKTSAVNAFVDKVNPHYVFFPVGYRNRYHFPSTNVLEKYAKLNTQSFSTVEGGAIQVVKTPVLYRLTQGHYWNKWEGTHEGKPNNRNISKM
jgi:competence protein ComEC